MQNENFCITKKVHSSVREKLFFYHFSIPRNGNHPINIGFLSIEVVHSEVRADINSGNSERRCMSSLLIQNMTASSSPIMPNR